MISYVSLSTKPRAGKTLSIIYNGKISSKVEELSLMSRESVSFYLMTLEKALVLNKAL